MWRVKQWSPDFIPFSVPTCPLRCAFGVSWLVLYLPVLFRALLGSADWFWTYLSSFAPFWGHLIGSVPTCLLSRAFGVSWVLLYLPVLFRALLGSADWFFTYLSSFGTFWITWLILCQDEVYKYCWLSYKWHHFDNGLYVYLKMDPKEKKPTIWFNIALNPGHPQFCGVPEILFRSSSTPQGRNTVSDALNDGGCQRTSLEKNPCNFTERLSENELVTVVMDSIYSSRETLSPDFTENRVRENHLSLICPPPVTTRRNKSVSFHEHVCILYLMKIRAVSGHKGQRTNSDVFKW